MSATEQLYCALIACGEDTLIVPNTLIAETIGLEAMTVSEGGPAWLAGTVQWNHQRLSALRFEALSGAASPPNARRARLVVLQVPGVGGDSTPLALLTQAYPHLITVTRGAIGPLPPRERDHAPAILARVRIGNGEALVPDLEHLQSLVTGLQDTGAA